jgi:TRAP-type transport system periplasmic protein
MRFSISTAALALVAAFLVSGEAAAQNIPRTQLRVGHTIPATASNAQGEVFLSEEVRKRSNGAVTLQMFWAGAGGSAAEMLKLVSQGGLDGGVIATSFYPADLPLLAAFSALPLSTGNRETTQKIQYTLWNEFPALRKEAEANNLHILRFQVFNEYHLLCTSPVRTIADLRGKRIRSQGEFIPRALAAVGATPVTVLPGEFYEALQRKTVDCILLTWDLFANNRLYEVAKFGSTISFGTVIAHAFAFNLDRWKRLDPSARTLIEEVANETRERDLRVMREAQAAGLETLKKNGVQIVEFTEQQKFESMMPDFIGLWVEKAKTAGKGAEAAEIAARWKQLR